MEQVLRIGPPTGSADCAIRQDVLVNNGDFVPRSVQVGDDLRARTFWMTVRWGGRGLIALDNHAKLAVTRSLPVATFIEESAKVLCWHATGRKAPDGHPRRFSFSSPDRALFAR